MGTKSTGKAEYYRQRKQHLKDNLKAIYASGVEYVDIYRDEQFPTVRAMVDSYREAGRYLTYDLCQAIHVPYDEADQSLFLTSTIDHEYLRVTVKYDERIHIPVDSNYVLDSCIKFPEGWTSVESKPADPNVEDLKTDEPTEYKSEEPTDDISASDEVEDSEDFADFDSFDIDSEESASVSDSNGFVSEFSKKRFKLILKPRDIDESRFDFVHATKHMTEIPFITCYAEIEWLDFPKFIIDTLHNYGIIIVNDILMRTHEDLCDMFDNNLQEVNYIEKRIKVQHYRLGVDYRVQSYRSDSV